MNRAVVALVCVAFVCSSAFGQRDKRKKKGDELDPPTQVLELPKDPPPAVVADSTRLSFHVAPLSAKGLLTQQVKDALNYLIRQTRGDTPVRIRALVAGSGDLRRIPAIVSEVFTEKRIALPTVTAIQVGGLPLEGAQVQLELIAAERKPTAAGGIAFVTTEPGPAKLAGEALLRGLTDAAVPPSGVRRIICFLHSLETTNDARTAVSGAFPTAAASYVQLRRDTVGDSAVCEAIAALETAPADAPLVKGNAVLTGATPLAFTGVQLGFGSTADDVRLAFQRMDRTLQSNASAANRILFASVYPLTHAATEQFRKVRGEFLESGRTPASATLSIEGLSSPDAVFGFDAVASAVR